MDFRTFRRAQLHSERTSTVSCPDALLVGIIALHLTILQQFIPAEKDWLPDLATFLIHGRLEPPKPLGFTQLELLKNSIRKPKFRFMILI